MNGSQAIVHTLLARSIDVCFANPGTSEMHFVAALDANPGMRCVLGLFEGVVTGAADGYYRMADKPAVTLLHLGPGLSNGLANLHNARRAASGVVNIVGQHALDHIANDSPLTSDIEGLARPVSDWVHTTTSADEAPGDVAVAVVQASARPGRVATLILPADTAWGDCTTVPSTEPVEHGMPGIDSKRVDVVARMLREAADPGSIVLLLGGHGMRAKASTWAGRIAAHTGCRLLGEIKSSRVERGLGRVNIPQIPYPIDQALSTLAGVRTVVLVGAIEPSAYFAYPGKPRMLLPDGAQTHVLADSSDDIEGYLHALAEALGAQAAMPALSSKQDLVSGLPSGKPTVDTIGNVIAACLPEGAIVVDEAITSGRRLHDLSAYSPPHDWLENPGGSIGYALPVAIGAALAAPDRKVLAVVGDGSAMFTLQALWTLAREGLDVTVVICSNRSYRILYGELGNVGAPKPGPNAERMLTLDGPGLDWPALAKGHGVSGCRVETLELFHTALRNAFSSGGPSLIELCM